MTLEIRKDSLLLMLAILATLLAFAAAPPHAAAQQGGTVRYVYDDNGRLIRVTASNGDTVIYEYDAAGNFTAIRRVTIDILALFDFSPKTGGPGDRVTFSGSGFGTEINRVSVSFNGAPGRVIEVRPATLVAEVPAGVTTGPVTITTPAGSVTTAVPFTLKSVRVEPSTASAAPSGSIQFTAIVLLEGDRSVNWSVNGVEGGSPSVGTITPTGLYTAPALPPFLITIRAASVADPSTFGEASVVVQSPDFALGVASSIVSIARAPLPQPPVSIAAVSSGVTIGREPLPPPPLSIAAVSPGVTIGRGNVLDPSSAIASIGASVSIQRQPAASAASPVAAISSVSAKTGPNISSVSPNILVRGTPTVITISGANLGGVTTIRFVNGSAGLDSSIVVSNISVSADGSSLTATITPGSSTVTGRRLVIVSTATGHSLASDTGTNIIQITQ